MNQSKVMNDLSKILLHLILDSMPFYRNMGRPLGFNVSKAELELKKFLSKPLIISLINGLVI